MTEDARDRPLREADLDPDPLRQFAAWLEEARAAGIDLPEAMTLATATRDGAPSARMVLLKGNDRGGFAFYTGYDGRKARELEENPRAALVFYWHELGRQVRVEGAVAKVSEEESAAYFATRPLTNRLSAWASRQSRVIESREVLEARVEELRAEFEGREVPLPPHWGGYRLIPTAFEFWQHRADRLHDRFRYTRLDDRWLIDKLSP